MDYFVDGDASSMNPSLTAIPTFTSVPTYIHLEVKAPDALLILVALSVVVGLPLVCACLECVPCIRRFSDNITVAARATHSEWDDGQYKKFLLNKVMHVGSDPWLSSWGTCCTPTGALEDFVRLVCNEHFFFAMFLADEVHPYTRTRRKVSFFCSSSFTFLVIVVASVYSTRYNNTQYSSFIENPYLVSFFAISPILLIFDTLLYNLVVCPCAVNTCCAIYETGKCISKLSIFLFIIVGVISFSFAVYVATLYLPNGFQFVVNKLVLGLVVYPIVQKLLGYILPYLRCSIGFMCCCCCYFSIMGGWKRAKDRENQLKHEDHDDVELTQTPRSIEDGTTLRIGSTRRGRPKGQKGCQVELGQVLLLYG